MEDLGQTDLTLMVLALKMMHLGLSRPTQRCHKNFKISSTA